MPSVLLLFIALTHWSLSAASEHLRLATTTSTQDSGLLDALHPAFEAQTGIHVDVIAVGSGKALALGRSGDVDVILAHDPAAEAAFMAEGAGVDRRAVMQNDFVIVGPASDPAAVRQAPTAAAALARIAQHVAGFVSRGDQSGTHARELALFERAGVVPTGRWYLAVGQGMGPVLHIADEKQAYTLADRGTWLALRAGLSLVLLFEGDPELLNPYHVLTVNPARHSAVKAALARRYADFLTGPDGQALIGRFEIAGQRLFTPTAAR